MRSLLLLATLVGLALAGATPAAGIDGATGKPLCVRELPCAPTVLCVPGIYCQATPCDPATDCRAYAAEEDRCVVDATIDGQTCAKHAAAGARVGGRNTVVPGTYVVPGMPIGSTSVYVPATGADISLAITKGFVHGEHLPNDWTSAAASVRLLVAGHDFGETGAGAYQSTIDTRSGSPTGTFTTAALSARHDGPAGGAAVGAGMTLLDGGLEDCYAYEGERDHDALTCQRVLGLFG